MHCQPSYPTAPSLYSIATCSGIPFPSCITQVSSTQAAAYVDEMILPYLELPSQDLLSKARKELNEPTAPEECCERVRQLLSKVEHSGVKVTNKWLAYSPIGYAVMFLRSECADTNTRAAHHRLHAEHSRVAHVACVHEYRHKPWLGCWVSISQRSVTMLRLEHMHRAVLSCAVVWVPDHAGGPSGMWLVHASA